MEQIERINRMEQALDEAVSASAALDEALDRYAAAQAGLAELTAYYESGQWMEDFDADRAGKLPRNLKRGVLSEDAVYNLLTDNARLLERLRALSGG